MAISAIRSHRPPVCRKCCAVGNTVTLAIAAALIGFTLGLLFGLIAGYFRDT
jgi:peptide/nickel transport system permease protein